jgi:hypothetical protein
MFIKNGDVRFQDFKSGLAMDNPARAISWSLQVNNWLSK